ncbi:SDR family NAD(P)-dependent oxidoreductase [Pseudonocardia sp. K10HN5]|uniref:SDR family NAD(P)-dependent oxidoreductase n=2 Tax=Pseudonocardia acidicola TaxID=2724939 RepID=A0ABX1S9A6_9PSEU|nr:SDR family NAD(P)-dependent oxidoreductase [Pseudonocardia acidicola]NMH96931.1 SDR family NAD(P)-dependent oxidoreductase [Pseudonocardia acidicola]
MPAPAAPGPPPPGASPWHERRRVGTVLVTGAASGLGRAVARAVGAAGGHPLLLDRVASRDASPELAGALSAVVDLRDTRSAERAVAELVAEAGELDAVVTTTGIDRRGRMADIPGGAWDDVVRVNLLGTAAVIRSGLPRLRESRGRIVIVAATVGLRALPEATARCAADSGVVGMSRALAAELAGQVGLTLLVTDATDATDATDVTDVTGGAFAEGGPGPHRGDPYEVADAVLYALTRPVGCEVREMVVGPATESSWP